MIAWATILPSVLENVTGAIKKAVPDKDLQKKLEAEVTQQLINQDGAEFQRQADIIVAEAQGEGVLQRNWRPIVMLTFAGLVVAHWLGWTGENLTQETINHLLTIVQVGLGGYVVGRSGEKIMREYKKNG
jgi:hypothetical protein